MTSASLRPASGFAAKRVTVSVAVQAWALSASATVGNEMGAGVAEPPRNESFRSGAAAALRRGPRIAAMRAWLPGCYACLQVGTLQMQSASVRASQAYRELDAAAEDCSLHTQRARTAAKMQLQASKQKASVPIR